MGNRGNIVILSDEGKDLFLYTHWTGSDLPSIVANALDRGRDRWDDRPYLNRILFSELIKDDVLGTTGYGLDVERGDGGTEVYVSPTEETVRYLDTHYTFKEFVEAFGA